MTERMFIIVGAFICGYCLGYCNSFDILKYKNRKHEIHDFFLLFTIKNMACNIEFLTKKMEKIKITDDNFLGNELSYKEKFLNSVIGKFGKEIKDCKVSFYLHRKSMSICCKTTTMADAIASKLLKIVDRLMDEHFFQTNSLRQLGWCAHYMLGRKTCKDKQVIRKTEVTEFYWFNNSPNRFNKQQFVTQVEVCNCVFCRFFMP